VICEPDPIPGEVAAARAGGGRYGWRPGAATGSIAGRR
jgi:hypothetical protein